MPCFPNLNRLNPRRIQFISKGSETGFQFEDFSNAVFSKPESPKPAPSYPAFLKSDSNATTVATITTANGEIYRLNTPNTDSRSDAKDANATIFEVNTQSYSCDGRQHCSQMHSCAEATYFSTHCPNTKMDGNHDGVPCEKQWCR